MRVSWRYTAATAVAAILMAGGLSASGQSCCTPPPPGPPPPPPPSGCCTPPTNLIVNVPGASIASANVSVGVSSTSVAAAGASTTLSSGVVASTGATGSSLVYSRAGAYFSPPSVVGASSISNLNVDGGYETKTVEETVPVTEDYCIERIRQELTVRPVQALCVDDENAPHPASRLTDATDVKRDFKGEVFRCVAGSHMQVTIGSMADGKPSFETAAQTFSCAKGESLWHTPDGALACKTQIPERNCNERSLLRRYGPGVKLVGISIPKPYCEPAKRTRMTTVTREVKTPRALPAGSLALDGGVGNGVQ